MSAVITSLGIPLTIFALTYLVLALGKVPVFRIDRAGAALIGAVALVATGSLSERQALIAIDFHTLGLLLGMMIVVGNLRLSGAFAFMANFLFGRARTGYSLLAITVLTAGLLAAFFVNDVICLVFAPILIDTAEQAGFDSTPFLLGLATASNVGSAATVTGNPQNMIVAGFAHLRYGEFLASLAPGALVGLLVNYAVIAAAYRSALSCKVQQSCSARPKRVRISPMMAIKAALTAVGALAGFALGYRTDLVALTAGALCLITRRVRPERIYRSIDWTMLLMFAGLFVVVGGAESTGLHRALLRAAGAQRLANPVTLAIVIALLSNLVSNVPAVLLFRPLMPALGNGKHVALILASVSTYAGNLTVMGSVANLIVIEQARRRGKHILFAEHLRVGVPIALLTIAIGILMLR